MCIRDSLARAPELPIPDVPEGAPPPGMEIESNIAETSMDSEQRMRSMDAAGTRTFFTCPACNGNLWQFGEGSALHYRCHVGHSFTDHALLAEQTRCMEAALWSAVRLMEEKSAFARRMAERRRQARLTKQADTFSKYADDLDREVGAIRSLVTHGLATRYVTPPEE
jgi:two-component system chemotaxis response regulator CheB